MNGNLNENFPMTPSEETMQKKMNAVNKAGVFDELF